MHDPASQTPGGPTDHQQSSGMPVPEPPSAEAGTSRSGLDSLLQELRVLLQGVQVLTGFLIVLPFQNFARIDQTEKWIYLVTFACALTSLILFSAPAAQHRLQWPLYDRARFQVLATRMIIIGLVPFSLALILATQLVVSQVLGAGPAFAAGVLVGALIVGAWWLFPHATKTDRTLSQR